MTPAPFPLSEQDLAIIQRDDEHTYDVSANYYNDAKERLSQQPTGPLNAQRKAEDEDDLLPIVGVAGAVDALVGRAPAPAAPGTPLVGQAPAAQGVPQLYHHMQNVPGAPGHMRVAPTQPSHSNKANRPATTTQPKKRNRSTTTLRHTMRVKPLLVVVAGVVAVAIVASTLIFTNAFGPSSNGNHPTPTPVPAQVFKPKMTTSGDMVPDGTIKLHGTGFPPGGQVVLKLDGSPITGDVASPTALTSPARIIGPMPLTLLQTHKAAAQAIMVKTDGTFDTQIKLPKDWQPGTQHHIQAVAQGTQGEADFDLAIIITSKGGTPAPTTCIAVSSTQISFTGTSGKSDPNPQKISISNCGDAGSWTGKASPDSGGDWLSIDKTSGTLAGGKDQTITVSASNMRAHLASGSYSGHITFTLGASAETVDVTLSVSSNPCIKADQSSLNFSGIAGNSDPAAQTVNISDCGDDEGWSTSITYTEGSGWLGVDTRNGTLKAGESKAISVSASNLNANLSAGTYHGTITFVTGEKSVTVNVTLTVALAPCIRSDQTSLTFTGIASRKDPASQQLTLTNCGADGSWSAVVDSNAASWLSSDTSGSLSGNASQKVTVSASNMTAGLSAGTYQGHITYTISTSIGTQTTTVDVTLNVSKGACISLSSSTFAFSGIANTSDPSPSSQKETATNCGDDGNWSAKVSSGATGWLSLDTSSGGLTNNSTQDVNVSASNLTGKLSAGTYTGTITFTITTASGDTSSQSATVTLTVYAPTCFQFSQINGQTASDPQTDPLTYTAVSGESNPSDQTATIANCGSSDSGDWTASASSSGNWLSVGTASGTLAAGASSAVTISAVNQSAGSYTGQIVFTLKGPGGSASITLNVTLTVQAGSCATIVSVDGSTPSGPSNVTLSFSGTAGTSSVTPSYHTVTMQNCGGDGTWNVSNNGTSWLAAGANCNCDYPTSGSIKAGDTVAIYVLVDPSTLSAGSYSGAVTFSIQAAVASKTQSTGASVTFDVQPNVTSCLNITAVNGSTPPSNNTIDFYGYSGYGSPSPQTVTLSNCGSDGTVTTSVSYDSNGSGWLTTNPDISGGTSLTANNQLSLDLYANPGSLVVGDYTAVITFAINNSAGTYTQTLTVNFHVSYSIG